MKTNGCHPTLFHCIFDFVSFLPPLPGPVSVRSHPPPETPGNSIGLEAIIRKALMGKYDDQSEERSPSNAANSMVSSMSAGPVTDGRAEDFVSQGAKLFFFFHLNLLFCYSIVKE